MSLFNWYNRCVEPLTIEDIEFLIYLCERRRDEDYCSQGTVTQCLWLEEKLEKMKQELEAPPDVNKT